MDRSVHNTNLLVWHGRLWLIDHGASLYFHHTWSGWREAATRPYAAVRDHVLLPFAAEIARADADLRPALTPETMSRVLALVPDEWLRDEPAFADVAQVRAAYLEYLSTRLAEPRSWVRALEEAREQAL